MDINLELAEAAAEGYSDDEHIRPWFAQGWIAFCDGKPIMKNPHGPSGAAWVAGYIAARDAPE